MSKNMLNSIRKYKNVDELIDGLEQRELIFPNGDKEIFKLYLKQYGYVSFIKKLSHDLMYKDIKHKIFKEEFTSNNLRYLFDIDRNISIIIYKYFKNIEYLFNSSLLKIIAKNINKLANCPYIAALDNQDLDKIFPFIDKKTPKFKKWEKSTLENFYDDLYKNFNNIDFDCREIIKENKSYETLEIKELIEKGWLKKYLYEKKSKKALKKDWEYLDIFSLFQIQSFSQLIRIFSYLSTTLKNEVIREFCSDFKPKNKHYKFKEEEFEEIIYMFSNLRNILMHNGSLLKFNYQMKEEKINLNIRQYFNIDDNSSTFKLNEVISIMESIINFRTKNQIFNEINKSIEDKINNRTNRDVQISNLLFEIIYYETRIKIQMKKEV